MLNNQLGKMAMLCCFEVLKQGYQRLETHAAYTTPPGHELQANGIVAVRQPAATLSLNRNVKVDAGSRGGVSQPYIGLGVSVRGV